MKENIKTGPLSAVAGSCYIAAPTLYGTGESIEYYCGHKNIRKLNPKSQCFTKSTFALTIDHKHPGSNLTNSSGPTDPEDV